MQSTEAEDITMANNTLTLLCSADWHIAPNPKFSEIDETGRPSRLLQFIDLAKDFVNFSIKNDVDACIIAGDIVDQATMSPAVNDVLMKVARIISEKVPLILVHGQHDLDTKSEGLMPEFHCALSRIAELENVIYSPRPRTISVKDFFICTSNWTAGHEIPQELHGDVFVGHGAVQTCTNWEGYSFNSGFDKEELLNRFKLSIIGDIHNSQTFSNSKGNKILIPGPPIQHNYKDNPTTGFWLCKLFKDTPPFINFHSIETINLNHYHLFLFSADANAEEKSSRLVHYRYRADRKGKEQTVSKEKFVRHSSGIKEVADRIIRESKIPNQDLVTTEFDSIMASISSKDRKVPRSKLVNIEISGFLSIDKFELKMKEFPDNCVIIGGNGSGKTSLVEAIYWGLTGSTTRGVSANDVINWYGDGTTTVRLIIDIEDVLYRISRSREKGKPRLEFEVFLENWIPYTGNTTKGTQDIIYDLIGLSDWEIKLLSYFSAKDATLYGTLGKSSRFDLISTLAGLHDVEVARDIVTTKATDQDHKTSNRKGKIEVLKRMKEGYAHDLERLHESRSKQENRTDENAFKEIEERRDYLIAEMAKLKTAEACHTEHTDLTQKLTRSRTRKNTFLSKREIMDTDIVRMTHEVSILREKLKTSLDGKCPTCGQHLGDDTVAEEIAEEISTIQLSIPSKEDIDLILEAIDLELETEKKLVVSIAKIESEMKRWNELNTGLMSSEDQLRQTIATNTNYNLLIAELETRMSDNGKTLADEETELVFEENLASALSWIKINLLKRNGILVSELSKQGQSILQEQVDYLTEGENIKITIGDDLNISAKFLKRKDAGYEQLSTGQARVVDVVMMTAINNIFRKFYGLECGPLGLVIYDEILSFLDPDYMDLCFSLIDKVQVPKKIIITHDINLMSRFSHRINATLNGAGSTAYSKNWS